MSELHRWLPPLVIACLAGCATQSPPPGAPTVAQVTAAATELAAANINPAEYAEVGTTLATQNCAGWFSTQVLQADSARSASGALSTVGGIAAAAAGGTPYGAALSAGASALSGILSSSAASLAGSTPSSIYGLVSKVEQAWLAAMPVPLTPADAFALVEAFSEQCNLPNIQNAVIQALNAVPVSAAVVPAPVIPGSSESAVEAAPPAPSQLLRERPAGSQTSRQHQPRHPAKSIPSPTSSSLQRDWETSGRPFTARLPLVTIGH